MVCGMPDKFFFYIHTFACHNSWMYMLDLNLCMTRNIIIVHPGISSSYFVVIHPRISILFHILLLYTHEFLFLCHILLNTKNFCLQCRNTHEYNDLIFDTFADRFMPDPHGPEPEHNMCKLLVLFIRMIL